MSQMSLRAYYAKLESDLAANLADSVIQHARYLLGYYPKNLVVHRLLGQALLRLGRSDEATIAFGRALSIAPDDAPAHLGLSEVADNARNGDDALYHAERAYEVNVNDTRTSEIMRGLMAHYRPKLPQRLQLTQSALARQSLRNGQYRQAIETLRGAVERRPERHDLRLLLAQALWQAGDRVEAAEAALEVLRVLPDALDANRIMTQLWLEEDRPSDAQRYLGVIEGIDPYLALELVTGQPADEEAFHIDLLDEASASQAAVLAARPDWLQSLPDDQVADQAIAEAASAGNSDVNWPAWSSGMLSRASEPAPAAINELNTSPQADNAADLFADFETVRESTQAESDDEFDDLPAFEPLSAPSLSAPSSQDTLLESQLDDTFLAAYESSSSSAVVLSSGSAADSDSFAFDFASDVPAQARNKAQQGADEADWMQEYAAFVDPASTPADLQTLPQASPDSGMLFSPIDSDEMEAVSGEFAADDQPALSPQIRPTGALAGEEIASEEEIDALNTYAELFDAPAAYDQTSAAERSNADADPLEWLRGSDIEVDESATRAPGASALQRDLLDESSLEMAYSDPTSVDPTGWLAGYDPNYRPVTASEDAPQADEVPERFTPSASAPPSSAPAAPIPDLFSDFDEEEAAPAAADADQFSWLRAEEEDAASAPPATPPHRAQTDELAPWLAPANRASADEDDERDTEADKAARANAASEATRLRPLFGTNAPTDDLSAELDLLAADLRAEGTGVDDSEGNDEEERWLQSVSEETTDAPVPGPRRGLTSMLQDANLSWLQNSTENTPVETASSGLTDDERLNQTLMSDALADAFTDDWMTQFQGDAPAPRSDEPDWLSALEPEATAEPDDSELLPNDYEDLFALAATPANAPAEPDAFALPEVDDFAPADSPMTQPEIVEPAMESWLAEVAPAGLNDSADETFLYESAPVVSDRSGATAVSQPASADDFEWLDLQPADSPDTSATTITPLYASPAHPTDEAAPPMRVTAELEAWLADAAAPVTGMLTNVEDDGYDTAFTAPGDEPISTTAPSLSLEPEDESGLDVTELSSRFRAEPLPEIDAIVQSADLPDWLAEVQPTEAASAGASNADLEALFSEENLRRAATGQLDSSALQFADFDAPAFDDASFGAAVANTPADWDFTSPAVADPNSASFAAWESPSTVPQNNDPGATLHLPPDSLTSDSWGQRTDAQQADMGDTHETDEWLASLGASAATATSAAISATNYGTVMLDDSGRDATDATDQDAQAASFGDSFEDVDWESFDAPADFGGVDTSRSPRASGFQITASDTAVNADAPRSAREIDPDIDVELGWLDALPLTDEPATGDSADALVEPEMPDWLVEASNAMEQSGNITSVDEYETRKFNIADFAPRPESQNVETASSDGLESWDDLAAAPVSRKATSNLADNLGDDLTDLGAWSALPDEPTEAQPIGRTGEDFITFSQDALDMGETDAPNPGIDDFLNEIEADYLPAVRVQTDSLRASVSDNLSLLDEIAADYLTPRTANTEAVGESTDAQTSFMLYGDAPNSPQDAAQHAIQDAMDVSAAYPPADEDATMTLPPPNATPDPSDRDSWETQQNSGQPASPEGDDALFSFGDNALPDWLKEAAPDLDTTSVGESGVSESGFAFEEAFSAGSSTADSDDFDTLFANTNAQPGASGADDGEDADSWLASLTAASIPTPEDATERDTSLPLASELDTQIDSEMDWLSEDDLGFAFGGDTTTGITESASSPQSFTGTGESADAASSDEFDLDAIIASQDETSFAESFTSSSAADSFTPPVYDPARSEAVSDTLPVRPDLSWLTDEDPAVAAQVGWTGSLDTADVGDPGAGEPAAQTYSETYADPYADLLSNAPATPSYSTLEDISGDTSIPMDEPDWGAVTQTEEQVTAVPAVSSVAQAASDIDQQATFAPETGEWPMQETWDAALESPVAQAAAPNEAPTEVPMAYASQAESDSFDLSVAPADAVQPVAAETAGEVEADVVNNPALAMDEDFRIEPLEETPTASDVAMAESLRAEADTNLNANLDTDVDADLDAELDAISGEPALEVFRVAESEPASYSVDTDTAYGETVVAQPDQLVDATPLEVTDSGAAADERFEDDGGDAGYYMYTEPEDTDIAPAINAPDWLNAMVPGLDVDTSATQDEPIETEFLGDVESEEFAGIGEPGEGVEGYGWLNEMVDEESQQVAAGGRRFSFSRLPAWLARRGGAQPTAQTTPATSEAVQAIPEDDSDLPEWLR